MVNKKYKGANLPANPSRSNMLVLNPVNMQQLKELKLLTLVLYVTRKTNDQENTSMLMPKPVLLQQDIEIVIYLRHAQIMTEKLQAIYHAYRNRSTQQTRNLSRKFKASHLRLHITICSLLPHLKRTKIVSFAI